MRRFCLVALVGLPGAGKTTACQQLMQKESLPFNILHVCYDNFTNINSENRVEYKEQREKILKLLKEALIKLKNTEDLQTTFQTLKYQVKNHQSIDTIIICDDNNYYRSMRYKLFQLAREYGVGYCQIYFKCSVNLALERNSLRSGSSRLPSDIIVRMSNILETPNIVDNKWEANTLVLQNFCTYKTDYNEIILHVVQFLDKPLHPLQTSVPNEKMSQSDTHELDLLLRKRIKILLSSKQTQNKNIIAKNLNEKRKKILKNYQLNNNITLQSEIHVNKYLEMLNIE